MKKIGEKKFTVPAVIILIIAAAVLVSMPVAKLSAKKAEEQKTVHTVITEKSGTNVEKYGFTFELFGETIKFPLELKKDFLDKDFTFMSYNEVKKIYQDKTADGHVILENVYKNIMFGEAFFSVALSDDDKPENSFESTDVTGISVGKFKSDIFSVNGYGCTDKMSSLLRSFGDGYTVLSGEKSEVEDGQFAVEYRYGDISVKITSEDGEIIALNAEYIRTK